MNDDWEYSEHWTPYESEKVLEGRRLMAMRLWQADY